MANRNKQLVSIKVHNSFFDNIFEPERRRLQNKLGVNFSQTKFTEYLAKSKIQIKYPKGNHKFFPRKVKKGVFDFNI